jgi:hypothetical protein
MFESVDDLVRYNPPWRNPAEPNLKRQVHQRRRKHRNGHPRRHPSVALPQSAAAPQASAHSLDDRLRPRWLHLRHLDPAPPIIASLPAQHRHLLAQSSRGDLVFARSEHRDPVFLPADSESYGLEILPPRFRQQLSQGFGSQSRAGPHGW